MKTNTYYLEGYINALESTTVDASLFADITAQRAFFRKKCLDCIDWDLLNGSELARRAKMTPAKLQDIKRRKSQATADDFRAILRVIQEALA